MRIVYVVGRPNWSVVVTTDGVTVRVPTVSVATPGEVDTVVEMACPGLPPPRLSR
jgi:hypothetical protein